MTRNEAVQIMGLSRKYTEEELKKTYRTLARKYHPDVAGDAYQGKFAQINEAYDLLSELGPEQNCVLTHRNIFDVERA